ncbi:MAG: hypothetical protein IIX86_02490 [Clostridia bacterium]|nr:hypothetical protein [Clostridia bacterium]
MNTKKTTKFFALFLAVIMCALTLAACSKQPPVEDSGEDELQTKYLAACDKLEQGEYAAAYELFVALGDYKDAATKAAGFRYVPVSYVGTYTGEGASPNETATVTLNENNLPAQFVISYEDGTSHVCTCTYNENGKLTRVFCTDAEGELISYESVYNTNGKIEKEIHRYYDGYVYTTEYTYDDKGRQIKIVGSDSDGYRTVNEYFYDDNGNMVKIAVENSDEVFSVEHIYDSNNVLTKLISRDADGNIFWTEDYLYNEQGQLLKITCPADGKEAQVTEYTYDEKGRLLSKHYHEAADGYTTSHEYTYTADGRTEKFQEKMPDAFEYMQESTYKLVYIPFAYTEHEWDMIVSIN